MEKNVKADVEKSEFRQMIYTLAESMSVYGPTFMAAALAEAACYIGEYVYDKEQESEKPLNAYWWAVWDQADELAGSLNTMETPSEAKSRQR